MTGLVRYLAGPGRRNEHINQRAVAASSVEVFAAAGAGANMNTEFADQLAGALDEARLVFGVEVTRVDRGAKQAAINRGEDLQSAVAVATRNENVWHCSLSVQPSELDALGVTELDDATWSAIAHDFMEGMGFAAQADCAGARWVAIHHGKSSGGNDHIHIAASRVRDDGSIVDLWTPDPRNPSRKVGDHRRAQQVCRRIAAQRGLRVVSDPERGESSRRGVSYRQEAAAEKAGLAEVPHDVLRRQVWAIAVAADSEAEFVRTVRESGMLINPRWRGNEVGGYSVGFPASRYANRDGQPVMHAAKKMLGDDYTLRRLRERWTNDEGARRDAVDAWRTAERDMPLWRGRVDARGDHVSASRAAAEADTAVDAETRRRVQRREHGRRLGDLLRPVAANATSEADFARALRARSDVVVRLRYERDSTRVSGYVVAFRPEPGNKPVWCAASYIGGLNLTELRARWDDNAQARTDARVEWERRPARRRSHPEELTAQSRERARTAADAATRWQQMVVRLPDPRSAGWRRAAGDTAATCAAAAGSMTGARQRSLNNLADALNASAIQRRPALGPGSAAGGSGKRVAALMMNATRDDATAMWMSVMRQLTMTASAIGDAMVARSELIAAQRVQVALADVVISFPAATRVAVPAGRGGMTQQPSYGARPTHLNRSSTTSGRGYSR